MKPASLVAVLLIAALAAVFYVQRRGFSNQDHERFQGALWRLKHLDATFNEDLLRARFSLLESYDGFQHYLDEMEKLTAGLQRMPRFVGTAGEAEILRSAGTFGALLRERRQAFERFKSLNAVLANSRRYFPVAVNELGRRLGESEEDRALNAIVQELTRVLLANATSTDELSAEALALPDQLQAWRARHPRHGEAAFVASLVRHGQQLLGGKAELDTLTRQLLTLATAEGIEQLSVIYERDLTVALQRAQNYRALLYAAGTLLALLAGYAFWAQRDANRRLEARVRERTGQLQAEVDERKRTAAALQSSEAFLHSLVENLPVHIFRKDRAGRVTFANKLFCDRLGRSRDQVLGATAFDLMPADQAKIQQEIDERIMADGHRSEAIAEPVTVNGELTYIDTIKVPVFDAAGECIGVQGMFLDVTARKRAETELAQVHRQLLETSRQAGMAEVATGVLHNVGNVLNSVNVSATLVIDQVRESKAANLAKLAAMLRERNGSLTEFLTSDPKGRRIPSYLLTLADEIAGERATVTEELGHLRKNIEHIKDIVAMQQSYAKVSGVTETLAISELMEDALRMNASSLARHGLEVVRDYAAGSLRVNVERHKVLQVLVNLIRNAKHACDDSGRPDKQVIVRIGHTATRVQLSVIDNGIGIPPENLARIFAHGFTTKKSGHGFGLHSGALVAKELGGSLTAHSAGPGRGAAFTLELPFSPEATS